MIDLRALQADLQSNGCNGLWAAPLWIAPQHWTAPQNETGEIDIFERGCAASDGYLLSFGQDDTGGKDWIVHDAWGEQNQADAPSVFTAYMTFDPINDKIDVYKCPFKSNPIESGTADCTKTHTHQGYYEQTSKQTAGGTEPMRLVSDVWNGCEALNCGRKPKLTTSDCHFRVTDIKLQFSAESTAQGSPFVGKNPDCNPLWHQAASSA